MFHIKNAIFLAIQFYLYPKTTSSAVVAFNKDSREVYFAPIKKQLSLLPSLILFGNSIASPSNLQTLYPFSLLYSNFSIFA